MKIKKILLLITLFLPIIIKAEDVDTIQEDVDTSISQENNDNLDTTRADTQNTNPIWTQPLIIDKDNHQFDGTNIMKFQENIVYKPSKGYTYPSTYHDYPAAIIIAKDNITIDLSGFTLSLDPSVRPNFMINNPTYGISIAPGIKNVKIISTSTTSITNQKGCITGFAGFAIYIYGVSQSFYSFDAYSNMVKSVIIDNLLITQNSNGIYATNALDITITNTNIIYNFSSRILYGIYFINVIDGVINSCKTNQNFSHSDVYGIYLEDTTGTTVENSQMNSNRSIKSGNSTGINLTSSTATSSYANQIVNCKANQNLCSFVTGKKSIGFNIENQSSHNIIKNCSSFKNSHSPIYSGSQTPSVSPEGIGFQLASSSDSNEIHDNQSNYHDSYGFYDASSSSTSFYTSNTAAFNPTENYSVTIPTQSGTKALPTIILYPDNISALDTSTPSFENVEIKSRN